MITSHGKVLLYTLESLTSLKGDALVVQYSRAKNDQEGVHCQPHRVFANPHCPEICPILSLAVLVFTRGAQRDDSSTLLFGPNAKERFSAWLSKICHGYKDEILGLGLSVDEIGTHSFRKGVASELSSNPGGPNPVSVYLRAGWTLGPVQGRYIFTGSGGDQFVGRAAAGLDVNTPQFATLPPHFDGRGLTVDEWELILPGYSTWYPNWLQSALEKSHPFYSCALWRSNIISSLKSRVQCGVIHNTTTGMRASGIPPHVLLSHQLSFVQNELQNVIKTIREMPQLIATSVNDQLQNYQRNPLSIDSMNDILCQIRTAILKDIVSSTSPSTDSAESQGSSANSGLMFLPQTPTQYVSCPTGKISDMWLLWWKGVPEKSQPPLRLLRPKDFEKNADRVNLSKLRRVIEHVTKLGQLNVPILSLFQEALPLSF
ncbi:hypothetical protein Ae201684_015069 [Aphanomyces euteiches]|uniref:Uncharacterized protein n=1 Tax=Aphanomyces euteiches TaxID=100861 RepID=A0A6G0WHL2_9STRA|nr:hypothetical protein Ae201684_015069 [Aphanomyces euteiches]